MNIKNILSLILAKYNNDTRINDKVLEECKKQARDLISRFPLYPEGYFED